MQGKYFETNVDLAIFFTKASVLNYNNNANDT